MIDKTLQMLGMKAKDKVTTYAGVITSVTFDLYGCVQVSISPIAKAGDTELKHGHWFDVARIELQGTKRVMPVPAFRAMATEPEHFDHGPAEKGPPRI